MKKFALIGKNIAYSFSPKLHNDFFSTYGLEAKYYLEDFQNTELDLRSWNRLLEIYDGFNVTIPFKEEVIPFLDAIDEVAIAVGAVNTVLVSDGKSIGYNTDVAGFYAVLDAICIALPQTAYILGSGGAAKVAYYALEKKGIKNIYYVSRSNPSDKPGAGSKFISYETFELCSKSNAILINATPVGSKQYENQMPISEKSLDGISAVIDLIYTPSETLLLAKAKNKNIACVNGYDMLMIQAFEAEKIWWEKSIYEVNIERTFFENYELK